jgi:hypothetical protein
LVSIQLRGSGAVEPSVERPRGLHVWNESILTRINPFGGIRSGGIWAGESWMWRTVPTGWGNPAEPLRPVKLAGARQGVFTVQVGVGSDGPIKGLEAAVSELSQAGGGGRISASAIQILYLSVLDHMPGSLSGDPSMSLLDALSEKPPSEVPARAGSKMPARDYADQYGPNMTQGAAAWVDGGADVPIWIKVRVPADAPAGEYQGTLTIRATGSRPVAVPVQLRVADWTLPKPADFVTHVGLIQSPDTLALKYKVPLWSDAHFKLVEKSCTYMGELGGKVAYIYLTTGTWHGNRQTTVYWVKQPDGSYTYDFRVFDRYLDLVQKYLKPEVVCLYVYHYQSGSKGRVSVLDPGSGQVSDLETPVYGPTPEAVAFWKPVMTEVNARLQKRGLGGKAHLGMVVEGGLAVDALRNWDPKGMRPAVDLFKDVWPEGKWTQIAHQGGGGKDGIYGAPLGYVMTVLGNFSPYRSKLWGSPDLPLVLIKHFRAHPVIDLRPTAERGSLFWAAEVAMGETHGIGPLGVDFWNLTAEERGDRAGGSTAPLEGGHGNFRMYLFTTAALLAPGPEGPVSTARFEMFREGLQACEARAVVEKALGDEASRQRLGDPLAKRCQDVLKERRQAFESVAAYGPSGEGWRWFANSGWEDLNGKLFSRAGDVAKALADK